MIGLNHYLLLGAVLFCLSIAGIIIIRHLKSLLRVVRGQELGFEAGHRTPAKPVDGEAA